MRSCIACERSSGSLSLAVVKKASRVDVSLPPTTSEPVCATRRRAPRVPDGRHPTHTRQLCSLYLQLFLTGKPPVSLPSALHYTGNRPSAATFISALSYRQPTVQLPSALYFTGNGLRGYLQPYFTGNRLRSYLQPYLQATDMRLP